MTRIKLGVLACGALLALLAACRFPELGVEEYATGLTNPRGPAFGPDGSLYVAEAGTGGTQVATGIVGPDGALYTSNWGMTFAPGDGAILRIARDR